MLAPHLAIVSSLAHGALLPATCTSPSGMTFVLVELADGHRAYVLNHELSVGDAAPFLGRARRDLARPDYVLPTYDEEWRRAMTSDDMPVGALTYRKAVWLTNRLSRRDGLRAAMKVAPSGFVHLRQRPAAGYRFLTTVEWTDLTRSIGASAGNRCESNVADLALAATVSPSQRWHDHECADGFPFAAPVWSGPAPKGIYGLFGNVSEMTLGVQVFQNGDIYHEALGLSWQDSPVWAEPTFRTALTRAARGPAVGVRLAVDPPLTVGFDCSGP
jgi:formylglycine-generating enzyme required for sulfatase activity